MADAMGITPHYYYGILAGNGKANLRIEHLESLLQRHNVNPAWVLAGKGDQFLKGEANQHGWIAGHIIPDLPVTAQIDEEKLAFVVGGIMRACGLPMIYGDLAYHVLVKFGKWYIYKNPDVAPEQMDMPALSAAFVASLEAIQSMVTAVFDVEPGKVSISFEGRTYSFVRLDQPAK